MNHVTQKTVLKSFRQTNSKTTSTGVDASKQRIMHYAPCNILKAVKKFSRNDNSVLHFKTRIKYMLFVAQTIIVHDNCIY